MYVTVYHMTLDTGYPLGLVQLLIKLFQRQRAKVERVTGVLSH